MHACVQTCMHTYTTICFRQTPVADHSFPWSAPAPLDTLSLTPRTSCRSPLFMAWGMFCVWLHNAHIHTYTPSYIHTHKHRQTYKQLSHTQVFHIYIYICHHLISLSRLSHSLFTSFWWLIGRSWHVGWSGPLVFIDKAVPLLLHQQHLPQLLHPNVAIKDPTRFHSSCGRQWSNMGVFNFFLFRFLGSQKSAQTQRWKPNSHCCWEQNIPLNSVQNSNAEPWIKHRPRSLLPEAPHPIFSMAMCGLNGV